MVYDKEKQGGYCKEYYEKNRDRILKNQKKYRKKNRDKIREYDKEYMKKYYQENKDRLMEYGKEYYQKNKEKRRKQNKKYCQECYQRNKEKRKEYYQNNKERISRREREYKKSEQGKLVKRKSYNKRRLKLKGYIKPIGISIEDQRRIIQRDKVCVYCGSDKKLSIDHIIPINNSGLNNFNNLVLACNDCNNRKQTKDVFKWCEEKGIKVPEIVVELLRAQQEQTTLDFNEFKLNIKGY